LNFALWFFACRFTFYAIFFISYSSAFSAFSALK